MVLVPGTIVMPDWGPMTHALRARGYCVYSMRYGNDGTGPIATSAHQLARFVDGLLHRTGAAKVSIVGHSQGGMMPRFYIKFLGGADKVASLIGLSPSNHGTTNPMIVAVGGGRCVACTEQLWGSSFYEKLNRGSETPGPVDYTVLQTLDDVSLVPYTSAFLSGPSSRVSNVLLQSACPMHYVTHLGMPSDPVVLQWVENALGRHGPANPSFRPQC